MNIDNEAKTQNQLSPPKETVVPIINEENTQLTSDSIQTPVFTPEDADINDMAKMELDNQAIEEPNNTYQQNEKPIVRDEIIQSVYLGDRPIIGGVKITKKKHDVFSKFQIPKINIPTINKPNKDKITDNLVHKPVDDSPEQKYKNTKKLPLKILIPIISGVVLIALSGGAYFAIKTNQPPQEPEQPIPVVNPESQKIKISGNFVFPETLKNDLVIMQMLETENQTIKSSLANINSINVDSLDSEILSIKFE